MKTKQSYAFQFDTGVKITDEELDETREIIKCTADEIDSEFLEFNISSEEPEYHRDGPMVHQVHGGGLYAELETEEFDVDLSKAAFIPWEITIPVNSSKSCDEYSYFEITGSITLKLSGVSCIKDEIKIGQYYVSASSFEVYHRS